MNKLKIALKNCFGIGSLDHEFDFSASKLKLIYAPNGTMKTSFAKTLDCIAKNDKKNLPSDRIYNNRTAEYKIHVDSSDIDINSIFVINTEDNGFDATGKISSFLASAELKKEYDEIYSELDKAKVEFIKKLKVNSGSSDCEQEFNNTFGESNLYLNLLCIENSLQTFHVKFGFKYNDIFDKKSNIKKFIDTNRQLISDYFNNYNKLLDKSTFFKKSSNVSFGTSQANGLADSIKDGSFFEAKHKLVLQDSTEIITYDKLNEVINNEINAIINNPDLKVAFDKIDKAIGGNAELRAFKLAIEKDNSLIAKLQNYDEFKKEVWLGYLTDLKADTEVLISLYKTKKERLGQIITEAKKEADTWKEIIDIFNERFDVPFTVNLKNQEDVILKQEVANLEFEHTEPNEAPINRSKEDLLKTLSRGEQRAYYILQIIFEIEARKRNNSFSLLVFDDISDSFDYKNKYAIIEYIKDFQQAGKLYSIILTHNFDFYRTLASRLGLNRNRDIFMALKKENRTIELKQGQYLKDVFQHFTTKVNDPKVFISMIPFVRNIIEYCEGVEADEYKNLTCCLHIKAKTSSITTDNVYNIYSNKLSNITPNTTANVDIKQFIYSTAESIINEPNIDEVLLENKITLSIAIRLRSEEFVISKLGSNFDESKCTSNQTQELYQLFKVNNINEKEKLRILGKVNMMTPENIHINAFMYEPLIDMSTNHLIDLYKAVKQL